MKDDSSLSSKKFSRVLQKMREKNHVDKLSLEWSESSSADNSQTERDILDELRPHKNIKELQIIGYRGTKFPNWLADPLFLKLVQLSFRNCKNCYSLPALGQLPCLKFLLIRGMNGITEVTEEFYGSLSSEKPFNSLEYLLFEDMPEWKQWHVPGSGEFPTLEKLYIINCPELSLETPIQLSSLKRFEVSGCPKVGFVYEGMKQIVELYIRDCNSVTSFPFSILPTTLKRIEISHCRKLKLEAPVGEMSMFLEYLRVEKCDCIDDISPELLPTARESLSESALPSSVSQLTIIYCPKLQSLPVKGMASSLSKLSIYKCPLLKPLLEFDKGEYWPNIAQFPIIEIDRECM